MHVAYCFDDRVHPLLGASLTSLLMNHREQRDDLVVHLVTDSATPELTRRLDALEQCFRVRLELHLLPSDLLESMSALPVPNSDNLDSRSVYLRLFLPELLPDSVGRLLYLDCDTITLTSLGELWRTDLAGAAVGAVPDPLEQNWAARHGLARYFNSGVMLLDLDQWRRDGLADRCLNWARTHPNSAYFGDQCAINVALADGIRALDSRWNQFAFSQRAPVFEAKPGIVHFLSRPKPTQSWYEGPGELFWRYLHVSPWRDFVAEEPRSVQDALTLARLRSRQGRNDEAVKLYERILDALRDQGMRGLGKQS